MKKNKKQSRLRGTMAINIPNSAAGRRLAARLALCHEHGTGAAELGRYALAGFMLRHRLPPSEADFLGELESPLRAALAGRPAPDMDLPPSGSRKTLDPSPWPAPAQAMPASETPPSKAAADLRSRFLVTG